MLRRIAHLDMDAFFASVELLAYPELSGQAVVVGGARVPPPVQNPDGSLKFARLKDYVGRGVVTTATYEARALGVFSGMGLMKSSRLAPEAILLPANFDAYRDYSRRFKAAVREVAPHMEDRGIDEIFLDLSESSEDSLTLARRLQAAVRIATGLSCSIGVAPNRLLAKIASDLQKPGGITLLTLNDLATRIWPMPTGKINGIGRKTAARLTSLGIETIGELAQTPVDTLRLHFGPRWGEWLSRAASGIDDSPIVTRREIKSISRETTFERDLHLSRDRAELSRQLEALCQQLTADMIRKEMTGRTVGAKLRFADFRLLTREITLPAALPSPPTPDVLLAAARQCLKKIPFDTPNRQTFRLLGVRVSALEPFGKSQTTGEEAKGENPQFMRTEHRDSPCSSLHQQPELPF
ncbi:MAG: DNA polymerase IV [Zoogloeaceae bacterium]|jgi:DNA polymerase-4|nr:DNA polymerase IV [Zoogloeaceae bacterium]